MGTIETYLTDPALLILIKAVLIAFVADWGTGTLAAVRDGTFQWSALPAILRVQGAQVGMIIGLAVISGGLVTPLGVLAVAAAASYGAKSLASVKDNLGSLINPDPEVNPIPEG